MFWCLLELILALSVFTLLLHHVPKLMFHTKMTVYYICLTLSALFLMPLFFLKPQDPVNYSYAAKACGVCSRIFGMKYTVAGRENMIQDRPCVIICNHQSSIDLFGFSYIWPSRAVGLAKKELLYAGPFGLGMWLCGTIFVSRGSGTAKEVTERSAKLIAEKQVKVIIFPEGTRNKNSAEFLPFKKGAFYLAVQAQVPIVPVVMSCYAPFYSSTEGRFEKGEVTVTVLPPIETKGLTSDDVATLTESTRDSMVDVYNKTSNFS